MRFLISGMALCLACTAAYAHHHAGHSSSAVQSASHVSGHRSARGLHAGKRSSRRSAARSYQMTPTPDRYREIQQALTDRGYFKGEVNGEWGADSADALKRFEADHNLTADGKLQAKAIIGLGLGRSGGPAAAPPAVAAPAPVTVESSKASQPQQPVAPAANPVTSASAPGETQ